MTVLNKLRQIAFTVRQPGIGQYEWVLIKQLGDGRQWTEFSNADCPYATYREAIAGGLMMLAAIIADFDTGPRAAAVEAAMPAVQSNVGDEDYAYVFLDRPARGPTLAESETAWEDADRPPGPIVA